MGEAFASWQTAATIWGDAIHAGMVGVFKALAVLLVAWHGIRVLWGALAGNAKRELVQGLWQLGLLGLIYQTVVDPAPVWAGTQAVVGGLYRLAVAPFAG